MIDPQSTLLMLVFAVGAGFLGALFGIGGGAIIVPVLTAFFKMPIKEAIAASVVAVVATSLAGASRYVKQELTNVRLGIFLEVATTAGAFTGALATVAAPKTLLYLALSAVLALLAVLQVMRGGAEALKIVRGDFASAEEDRISAALKLSSSYFDASANAEVSYRVRGSLKGSLASYFAGLASGSLGIGGGVLKVPVMNELMNVPIKAAAATSIFMVGVTASTAAMLYYASGLVNPSIAAPLVIGVVTGSAMGTFVMNRIKPGKLKTLFGLILLSFAYLMLAKGIRLAMGIALPGG